MDMKKVKAQAEACAKTLLEAAELAPGSIVVVGCSTSEIIGQRIGSNPAEEAGEAVFEAIYPLLEEKGLYLAAQCCEHLNLSLIHIFLFEAFAWIHPHPIRPGRQPK